MSGRTVRFEVLGRPRPQGSKRPVRNPRTGAIMLLEQSKHVGPWREHVAFAAQNAGAAPTVEPVRVTVVATFERPKGHYRTGKNAHVLKGDAPLWPTTRSVGDVDKLARAVLDALTGVAFKDDSQVVELEVTKQWGSPEACAVTVTQTPGLPGVRSAA